MSLHSFLVLLLAVMLPSLTASGQNAIEANQAIAITIQGVQAKDSATINNSYPVSQSGSINMPYIGHVRAAGLLPDQLATKLESEYKKAGIYTNPTFQVVASDLGRDIVTQTVTVGGDVRSPGQIPFTNRLTLWQAVQAAGGENEFGSIKRVRVIRDGKLRQYDLRKPDHMQIPLRPNDAIQVPRKGPFGG